MYPLCLATSSQLTVGSSTAGKTAPRQDLNQVPLVSQSWSLTNPLCLPVCDWRDLNKITVKNKACLPNVDDLFDAVQGASYFTNLDFRSGYNQIRIQAEDVPKTAINTPFGHYQFRVMGFGLTNAPATFQSMMNTILQPYLREFVVVFLDDILIFSKTWSEHMQHVRSVLSVLRDNQLFRKRSKCEFGAESVLFLGHCIDGLHIAPDPDKIAAVKVWPAPTSVTEVRQFLEFTNYFRRFIDQYSSLSKNVEEITGKHARFEWNSSRQHAFESLKHALLNAPLLRLADVNRPFRVVTDASHFALGCVLLQELEEDAWHPVAYASRKLSAAEQNYTATERETLAIVFALKTWRIHLYQHFVVITDNMAVVYLKTKPSITKREARWVEFLADYDYTVRHRPGRENPADPLSRRPDLHERNLVENAVPRLNAIEYALAMNDDVSNTISDAYQRDKELTPIIERLKHSLRDNLHDRYYWDESTDRLYLKASPNNRLCIPQCGVRLKLIQEHHECATAGHPGRDRTYFRLARFSTGPEWVSISRDLSKPVISASERREVSHEQGFSSHFQYLIVLGRISQWILLLDCPLLLVASTQFTRLWTDLRNAYILFQQTRRLMLRAALNCTFKTCFVCTGWARPLFPIAIHDSLQLFSKKYSLS